MLMVSLVLLNALYVFYLIFQCKILKIQHISIIDIHLHQMVKFQAIKSKVILVYSYAWICMQLFLQATFVNLIDSGNSCSSSQLQHHRQNYGEDFPHSVVHYSCLELGFY